MKRSEINKALRGLEAICQLRLSSGSLPVTGTKRLGWDITDYSMRYLTVCCSKSIPL